MKEKRRFFVLAGILLVMIMVFTSIVLVSDYTKTRLIQRKQDEVKAYYTALYFNATGEGSAIALDNSVGYFTFDLMNYIGEDVTERDIVYEIKEPSKYYTNTNIEIDSDDYDHKGDFGTLSKYAGANSSIHVHDVWNQPKEVGRDTYKYTVDVVGNTGEEVTSENLGSTEEDYVFKYEKLEGSDSANAVGKTHTVTVQIDRGDYGSIDSTENLSIVIQLLKPYIEVYIINIVVSERLIIFSNSQVEEFEQTIEELNIQTIDIFSHTKENNLRVITTGSGEDQVNKVITSNKLKVTLTWSNLILNEVLLEKLPGELVTTDLNTLNGNSGTIELLIPQGSSFKLQFYPTSTSNYSVTAKVEIVDAVLNSDSSITVGGYNVYNELYGGYSSTKEIGQNGAPANEILVLNKTEEGLVH